MRTRITHSNLISAVDRLNDLLGHPRDGYARDAAGNTVAAVGAYTLYRAYGATRLVQIDNPAGGCRDITPLLSRRELLGRIHAMMDGVDAAIKVLKPLLAATLRERDGDDARIAAMQAERDGDALMQDAEIAASLV
jgi:hypothetical protein